jgi:hypothetical protein
MTLLRTALIVALAVSSTACIDMFKNIFNSPTRHAAHYRCVAGTSH